MEKKRARRRRDEQSMRARVRFYASHIYGVGSEWLTGKFIGVKAATHYCDCDRFRCRIHRQFDGPSISERRKLGADELL